MQLERFDRYLILNHLIDGGMAKISRALYLGEEVDKLVVIKTMKKQYSEDPVFRKMFMDEIKITFGLLHSNIVQTYDYGFVDGQLYVVMEYCDGKNLKEFIHRLNSIESFFPIDVSVYIISQACLGLHYAHNYSDKLTGKNANIIHRDISPHNIMLNFDGGVKVIDFGIAKAETNTEVTKTGTLKGKLGYLAPEYIDGVKLDPRYDEFALGITLWEMLCGRRLFTHQNDIELIRLVQKCEIPLPSSINKSVPPELDAIVMKALSKDRENRYPDMFAFHAQLNKFLYSFFPDFHAQSVAEIAHSLFENEIKEDMQLMKVYGKINLKPYLEDMKKEANSKKNNLQDEKLPEKTVVLALKQREIELDLGGSLHLQAKKDYNSSEKEKVRDSKSSKKTLNPEIVIADLKAKSNSTKTSKTATLRTISSEKSISKKSNFPLVLFLIVILVLFGIGSLLIPKNPTVVVSTNESRLQKKLEKLKEHDEPLVLLKNFDLKKMRAYFGGAPSNASIIGEIVPPTGDNQILRVQTDGRSHFIIPMKIVESSKIKLEVPEMPAAAYGWVTTNNTCPKGQLFYEIYGEKRVSTIPLSQDSTGIGFPLKSDFEDNWAGVVYEVKFYPAGKKEPKNLEIKIDQVDQNVDLCILLNELI